MNKGKQGDKRSLQEIRLCVVLDKKSELAYTKELLNEKVLLNK